MWIISTPGINTNGRIWIQSFIKYRGARGSKDDPVHKDEMWPWHQYISQQYAIACAVPVPEYAGLFLVSLSKHAHFKNMSAYLALDKARLNKQKDFLLLLVTSKHKAAVTDLSVNAFLYTVLDHMKLIL